MRRRARGKRPSLAVPTRDLVANPDGTEGKAATEAMVKMEGGPPSVVEEPRSPEDATTAVAMGFQSTPPARKRGPASLDVGADVFITSYGTLRCDVELLEREQGFGCMVLDEAQQIKNHACQTTKAVKRMVRSVGSIRVAMTGTPVENRLSDLHSIFEFALPGYLAESRAEFDRDFARPLSQAAAGQEGAAAVAEKQRLLKRVIQPFVLRRMKTDPEVAADLPDKVEQTHFCDLVDGQAELYRQVQEAKLADAIGSGGTALARQGRVLALIHAFREVCNHPASLKAARQPPGFDVARFPRGSVEASGKTARLHDLLEGIFSNGEKAVIFCNYLETIDILAEQIEDRFQERPLKLIGAMAREERDCAVDSFQTDPARRVLLLSLQAGGVGITLTAATHVIHFDRCYNPAKENQATDRAHRIGQDKTVFVHRLVARGTFEERLAAIMAQKQGLSDITLQSGEGWIADLGDAELRDLFSLGGGTCDADLVAGAGLGASTCKRRKGAGKDE